MVRDFIQRVERSILERRLIGRGDSILVAVSGGLDSMVLLRVLARLAGAHGWLLVVAHFNHQLRGRGSDADERLAQRTAAALGLGYVAGRADVRQFGRKHKLSVEMAARQLRHEFLARAARERGIRTIALAHHADDQVELFFLRLLRGAGPEGLAGMRWSSSSPYDPAITLVRPLLAASKAELRQFARREKVPFREDATNRALDYRRNRIRHELLPLLRGRYQPALDQTILRLMELAGAESDFVAQHAREWLAQKRRVAYARLPVALQRRGLQLQLRGLGVRADFELVERLRAQAGQPVSVGPRLAVFRDDTGGVHCQAPGQPEFNPNQATVRLEGRAGAIRFEQVRINWRLQAGPKSSSRRPRRVSGVECFDADKVGPAIVLRHWQPGDRFQPIGMGNSVKLQDLFANLKIPRARRHELIVATTAGGELFWVQGLRMAERFKLDEGTVRRLHWRWQARA